MTYVDDKMLITGCHCGFRANLTDYGDEVLAHILTVAEKAIRNEIADESAIITEWAVQYDHGVHSCDDEMQAEEWQPLLPQPNRVVRREVRRGPWLARSEEATE